MPTPPSLVQTFATDWAQDFNWDKVTANFDVVAGDIVIVHAITADSTTCWVTNIAGGSLTWTKVEEQKVGGSTTYVATWWALVDSNKTMAVTITKQDNFTTQAWGCVAETWRGSDGIGAHNSTTGTGAPSLAVTTTAANSAVSMASGDWVAVAGTGREYRLTHAGLFTEFTYLTSSDYTIYTGAHLDAGSAAAKTIGLSLPVGQTFSTTTIEVKGKSTGAPPWVRNPVFQGAGAGISGTGAVTPVWPVHATDDIALLVIESCGGQAATLTTANGFAAVTNSPQATGVTTAGTQITVFWCRATSAAMSNPVVADPGDHVYARIFTFRGCVKTGNPWDATAGSVKAAASTTVTLSAVTTTVRDCLIVLTCARDTDSDVPAFSAEVNANLTSITEVSDLGTTQGNGGGFLVATGVMANPGSTGTTAATVSSSINAFLTISLMPQPVSAPIIEAAHRRRMRPLLVR